MAQNYRTLFTGKRMYIYESSPANPQMCQRNMSLGCETVRYTYTHRWTDASITEAAGQRICYIFNASTSSLAF